MLTIITIVLALVGAAWAFQAWILPWLRHRNPAKEAVEQALQEAAVPVKVREIQQDVQAVQQAVHGQPASQQATFTGNLANTATATLVALDALGGAMRNIRVKVFYSGATAGLGITPQWFVTRYAAPTTFTQQTVPSQGAQHVLAAATVEDYEVGDLPEGLQAELRVASNSNDSALAFEATVTYED